jgi:flagellar basal body P-ring protein FlgI
LTTPAFFDAQATGKPLGDSEQSEFNDFLAKFKTASPTIEVNSKNPADPFVTVKLPPSANDGDRLSSRFAFSTSEGAV